MMCRGCNLPYTHTHTIHAYTYIHSVYYTHAIHIIHIHTHIQYTQSVKKVAFRNAIFSCEEQLKKGLPNIR